MNPTPPHGGAEDLYLSPDEARAEKQRALEYPSLDLDLARLGQLDLLLGGGFAPLRGYLGRADLDSVLDRQRLADGTLWPLPLTLTAQAGFAAGLAAGDRIALREPEGVLIAVLELAELWPADDPEQVHLAGRVHGIEPPLFYDFPGRRFGAADLRRCLDEAPRRLPLTALAVGNPPDAPAFRAAHGQAGLDAGEGSLLVAARVGTPGPDDRRHYARVRALALLAGVDPAATPGDLAGKTTATAELVLLPLPVETPVSPADCLLTALVMQNYGCTRLLTDGGEGWRAPAWNEWRGELAIDLLAPEAGTAGQVDSPALDALYASPAFRAELDILDPPPAQQGFTVFFTGLSGSGKSTVANVLLAKLLASGAGGRDVTLLDGDRVRKNLSSELGFSKEHRNLNILRIGYVASEISKHGGVAICAPIAPYRATRQAVREMVEAGGGFVEVHIATSLEECERRDRKGLYAKARAGLIKEFTGISDPYEAPEHPDVRIDTGRYSPDEAAGQIMDALRRMGYLN